ncbi:MAG: flavodoxin-dependent (E)-4-hydroxy-3-methylbut-2-enyl-diphosphate synthase [Lentisphaeria bacterium]|nr:flavodoxin-dependent (E)-4-hydroxy-3-methylbut-2-enyl-diphosphate synthase [Lentisphaeria bacterium]
MQNKPRISRRINIGSVPIGGLSPVSIQSMTNTDTRNAAATISQIRELAQAGCEIIRVTVPDEIAAAALPEILANSPIPVIADIHFDYRLAIRSIEAGIHGIRLNPGNIGSADNVRMVAEKAGEANVPIRVGANSGSLPHGLLEKKMEKGMNRADAMAEALVEAVQEQIRILEQYSFQQLKVSLKASSVPVTVKAYRIFAQRSDYPLHIGVTEAGTAFRGAIKSAVGIGSLLLDGIGDTLRVSLSAPPVEEIRAAKAILEAAGIREAAPEIVSCPTCGRTNWDLISMVNRVEDLIAEIKSSGKQIKLRKVAVMGCAVNGPGEAADADIGIAGGNQQGKLLLFKKGAKFAMLPEQEAFELLKQEISNQTV